MLTRLLFGPRTWPGPQYDREFVRAYRFDLDTARAAAEAMMSDLRSRDPDAVHLEAIWEADGQTVQPDDLGHLDNLDDVKINAYGALLQIGRKEPAMIYYGDADGQRRVLQGYAVLEREGHLRLQSPALLSFGALALAVILVLATIAVEFFTNVGPWAWAAAVLAAVIGGIEIARRISSSRKPRGPGVPHSMRMRGSPRRSGGRQQPEGMTGIEPA